MSLLPLQNVLDCGRSLHLSVNGSRVPEFREVLSTEATEGRRSEGKSLHSALNYVYTTTQIIGSNFYGWTKKNTLIIYYMLDYYFVLCV